MEKTLLIEKEIHGSRMLLDTNDPGLSADLWREGTREWSCPDLVHKIVELGWTCIDAGANLGYYTLMLAKLVGQSGAVHAIEPCNASVDILDLSCALNSYENVVTHCMAVGDKNGMIDFLISPYSNLCRVASEGDGTVVKVPEITLDAFVEKNGIKRLDFLRHDIESYEVEMVAGAQKTLAAMPRGSWIFGEWHICHKANPVEEMMPALQNVLDHGFLPVQIVAPAGSGLSLVDPKDFARACCVDYPHTAPRVFFRKV